MDIQIVIEQANINLAKMDLPINRRDVRRQSTVHWLLNSLRVRNHNNPKYKETMLHLLTLAKHWNLMSAKDREQLEKSL